MIEIGILAKGIGKGVATFLAMVNLIERADRARQMYEELRKRRVSLTVAAKAAAKSFLSSKAHDEMDNCIVVVDASSLPDDLKRHFYEACVAKPRLTRRLLETRNSHPYEFAW